MATRHPTDRTPLHQPARRRCGPCNAVLCRFRDDWYCPDCTFFAPAAGPRPRVEVTVTLFGNGGLLQCLSDADWDVVVETARDSARLYHPKVRTGAEARARLSASGFDLSMFDMEE